MNVPLSLLDWVVFEKHKTKHKITKYKSVDSGFFSVIHINKGQREMNKEM
jgi:hypothetical protein